MSTDDVDWGHTAAATAQRRTKARTLARFAWEHGVDAGDIRNLERRERTALARAAGVAPPSTGETWSLVAELLHDMTTWAHRHPSDGAARRPYAGDRTRWLGPQHTPAAGVTHAS